MSQGLVDAVYLGDEAFFVGGLLGILWNEWIFGGLGLSLGGKGQLLLASCVEIVVKGEGDSGNEGASIDVNKGVGFT